MHINLKRKWRCSEEHFFSPINYTNAWWLFLCTITSFISLFPSLVCCFFLFPFVSYWSSHQHPSLHSSQISYSLLNDRSGDYQFFRIDPELGSIYTEAVFDRETKGSYLLEVNSMDGWESARPGRHGQPNSGMTSQACFLTQSLC